jgi:hypothetical protein
MTLKADGVDHISPISQDLPETRARVLKLLSDIDVGNKMRSSKVLQDLVGRQRRQGKRDYLTLQPAWREDGPTSRAKLEEWKALVECCAEESELPKSQRGLFVGITAIFYAAKLAGCDSHILGKQEFLAALDSKTQDLLASGGSGRDLANLTLVAALVDHVLHHKAKIVCKRSWACPSPAGNSPSDVVATWTLGMYLKHLAAS